MVLLNLMKILKLLSLEEKPKNPNQTMLFQDCIIMTIQLLEIAKNIKPSK